MRFDLVIACLHRPKLLALDEPLANLDVVSQQFFLFDMRQLTQSANRTAVIISSQHLYEMEAVADELIVLDAGNRVRTVPRGDSSYFEISWERSDQISEQRIREAYRGILGCRFRFGTTSCILAVPRRTDIAEVVASSRASSLHILCVRDITHSARLELEHSIDGTHSVPANAS
jgi:energy-coupling factor transporter ATP-binding protein EcfA2